MRQLNIELVNLTTGEVFSPKPVVAPANEQIKKYGQSWFDSFVRGCTQKATPDSLELRIRVALCPCDYVEGSIF